MKGIKKTLRRKGIRRDVRTKRQEDEEKGRKKRENMESAVGVVMLRKYDNTGGTELFELVK